MIRTENRTALPSIPLYTLGDPGSESDMRTFTRPLDKLSAIQHLTPKDYAFVHRSDGRWQYSRVVQTFNVNSEPRIKFLLDEAGRTKTIPMRQWVDHQQPTSSRRQPFRRMVSRDDVPLETSFLEPMAMDEDDPMERPPVEAFIAKPPSQKPGRRRDTIDSAPHRMAESCDDLLMEVNGRVAPPMMRKRRSSSCDDVPFEMMVMENDEEVAGEAMIMDEECGKQDQDGEEKGNGGVDFLARLQEEVDGDKQKRRRRVTINDCKPMARAKTGVREILFLRGGVRVPRQKLF